MEARAASSISAAPSRRWGRRKDGMVMAAVRCDHRDRSGPQLRHTPRGGDVRDHEVVQLREAIRNGALTPFVGAGLSSAVTGNVPCATWQGLLLDGVDACKEGDPRLPAHWADTMKKLLTGDMNDVLSVGDQISRRLRGRLEGRAFKSWMDRTVGALEPKDDASLQIIESIRRLGAVIVTTNYDTLIERPEPNWVPYTWTDGNYASAFRKSNVVLHLHGVATNPKSIILGSADYQKLEDSKVNDILGTALFMIHSFIFIGCGEGLADPHLAPLLKKTIELVPEQGQEHFLLVTDDQRAKLLQDNWLSPRITPVAYGDGFDKLPAFLQELAANRDAVGTNAGRETDGQQMTTKPASNPLIAVAMAQKKLRRLLDSEGGIKEELRKVESCRAVPVDMDEWDPAEEEAEHKRLAERLVSPAADLDVKSKAALAELNDAITDVWRLTEPAFIIQPGRLRQITDMVSQLESASRQSLVRVTRARDDLDGRSDVCPDYEAPFKSLLSAHMSLDKAFRRIAALRARLSGQHATQETSEPSAQPPQTRMSPLNATSTDRSPTHDEPTHGPVSARFAPVSAQAAAGPAISIGEGDEQKVAVPPQYSHRDDVRAIRVKGNSLEADAILDGDFVTVIPELEPYDNEMVAVTYGGESDTEAQVKWLRLPEGADPYLQGSDPSDITELKEADRPEFYKVIGVVRWDIKRLS
jgi:SOS-response transcriptional repressor LexA